MTRLRRMVWTPLVLGGIAPGLLVLAVLAASFGTHAFSPASDHVSAAAAVQGSVRTDQDGDRDDRSRTPGAQAFFHNAAGMLAIDQYMLGQPSAQKEG